MTVTGTVYADKSYLELKSRIENTASTHVSYQYWINAMASPGNKDPLSSNVKFIFPEARMRVHSTAIAGLSSGQKISWPQYGKTDFSLYSNWQGYLGLFGDSVNKNYIGVYNLDKDEGLLVIFDNTKVTGTKLFAPKGIAKSTYTSDNGQSYVELWTGVSKTFDEDAVIAQGSSLEWTEYVLPLSGLGSESIEQKIADLAASFSP